MKKRLTDVRQKGGVHLRKKDIILQQSEWILMEKLWDNGFMTIMQLFRALEVDPGWSKSTVNTMLKRMMDKEIISYKEGEKARQYYPLISRDEAALAETESLLDKIYEGSVSLMMSTLVKKKKISKKELDELYDILNELEG